MQYTPFIEVCSFRIALDVPNKRHSGSDQKPIDIVILQGAKKIKAVLIKLLIYYYKIFCNWSKYFFLINKISRISIYTKIVC